MLRDLSVEEVALVSGGMMEDADEFDDGSGYGGGDYGDGDYGQTVSQDVPSPTDVNGDIVVTATRDQVNDAKNAYTEAEVVVDVLEYGSMAAGVLIGASELAWAAKVIGGTVAGSTTLVTADNKAAVTNTIADAIYYKNREDPYGQYDSVP